jgi:predicted nucleic acid-binding protein
MTVIADSTPLIALSRIQKLPLLREIFGNVIIPEAVYHEVVIAGRNRPGVLEVTSAEWISVRKVSSLEELKFAENLDEPFLWLFKNPGICLLLMKSAGGERRCDEI